MSISGLDGNYNPNVRSGLSDNFKDSFTSNFANNETDNKEGAKEFDRYLLGLCPCCKAELKKHNTSVIKCLGCGYSRPV